MLSHLRFHRRNPSNPRAPLPDQLSQWESAALHEHPQTARDVSPRPGMRPRSSNSNNTPPFLPPIARVTSAELEPASERRDEQRPALQDPRPPPPRPSQNVASSGFMGGVALQNYRRGLQGNQRPESAGSSQASILSEARPTPPLPPPLKPSPQSDPPPVPAKAIRSASSFVVPTELQGSSQPNTGKRPAGLRLATEPAILAPSSASSTLPEAQRGKKGLPFLKNPMSTLLLRRRTSQNAPDILPLPLNTRVVEEPMYDPRIRGTRVHDFSAPRTRRITSTNDLASVTAATRPDGSADLERSQILAAPKELPELPHVPRKPVPNASKINQPDAVADIQSPGTESLQLMSEASRSVEQLQSISRRMSYDLKPLPEQPLPPLPIKDDAASSLQTSSSGASRVISLGAPSTIARSSPSTKASFSRNVSLSGASFKSSKSGKPKHMKSTSSRFSFDMIGAAKQEKLLEERHRQRQLEKTTSGDAKGSRDSRFDDDMEDDFDYDAMMDDDGLEERIPGVNADLDDYEQEDDIPGIMEEDEGDGDEMLDLDNDQVNFSGFTFQRSDPSPGFPNALHVDALPTPRDAAGKVIGSAVTKDITPDLHSAISPAFPEGHISHTDSEDSIAGLGIQGLDVTKPLTLVSSKPQPDDKAVSRVVKDKPAHAREDDLYFDEGLADELDFEHDGTHFDESLFDLNDTDQYGRPLPGVFAEAKSRSAAKQEAAKRESDMTSRMSAQSGLSQSTAHTSLSVGPQPVSEPEEKQEPPVKIQEAERPSSFQPPAGLEKVAAYQAALAEAAHMAAASGKFRRDSSPEPPTGLTVTSPTDSSESHSHSHPDNGLENYEDDDGFTAGMDDYDFDDDAIIAEANASALANDSDGFYSQEFGFYSSPMSQGHHPHGHGHHPSTSSNGSISSSSAKVANGNGAALSAENLFQYAHGGYFGPAGPGGVDRSGSGRIVSREPNLTPITERSEYSNRNSIMSLAVPPGGFGGSSGSALASPGLAQLAMMADDDDMSLSAFLRLRAKAFNGSQVSLASSSRDGSPRSERGAGGQAGGQGAAATAVDGTMSPWSSASGFLGVGMGMGGAGGPPAGYGHGRKNSAFSVWSRDSDAGSGSGSPTLTMAMPAGGSGAAPPPLFVQTGGGHGRVQSPPPQQRAMSPVMGGAGGPGSCPPVFEEDDEGGAAEDGVAAVTGGTASMAGSGLWMKSPGGGVVDATSTISLRQQHGHPPPSGPLPPLPSSASNSSGGGPGVGARRPPMMGHRHKGSADSISYIKEEESSGETRWVVERRRTAETGEVEILGREVVEGGMI